LFRKRKMNVVSVWIIVIFTVIAITLVSMFMVTYNSIMRSEIQATLREQVEVLRDNADSQVVDVVQNQLARRLATKDAASGYIGELAAGHIPSVEEIRALTGYFVQVQATQMNCERVELYFPSTGIVMGSHGVQYLTDRKYTVSNSIVDYMRALYPSDGIWVKRTVPYGGGEKVYFTFLRMYPGIYPAGQEPMLAVSIEEVNFLSLLRSSMRTLNESDTLMLVDPTGVIWSTEDAALLPVGASLPEPDLAADAVRFDNGYGAVDGRQFEIPGRI